MAAAYVNSSAGDTHIGASSSGTLTITKPTGAGASNQLFLSVNITNGSSVTAPTLATPTGWTLIGTKTQAGATFNVGLWTFTAPGDVAALGFNYVRCDDVGWKCQSWTGVDAVTPFTAGTAVSSTAANSLTLGAITSAVNGSVYASGLADWLGGTYSVTGYTNDENTATNAGCAILRATSTTINSGASSGTVAVADSASATGQVIVGVPFLIRASAGGATSIPNKQLIINRQAIVRASHW